MYKLKAGLPYNTDCFSYWQGTIQASYAVMRQLLFIFAEYIIYTHNFDVKPNKYHIYADMDKVAHFSSYFHSNSCQDVMNLWLFMLLI